MINTPSRRYSPTLICEDPLILAGGDRGPLMDYDKPERWTRIGLSEEPRHGGDQR
jgi:hypothetical protein